MAEVVRYTRIGRHLIAKHRDGRKFRISKYSSGDGWETAIYSRNDRLGVPYKGLPFPSLREAFESLIPDWCDVLGLSPVQAPAKETI
jgi:hypothetical protein